MLYAVCADYRLRITFTQYTHFLQMIFTKNDYTACIYDWDSFIENCEDEEYAACTVIIDGEKYKNAGIRAKGNTSLSAVSQMDSRRYSFKIEFDHYQSGLTYHGLDKLCLNNIIQDNTYMKDYLTYRLMDEFGVDSPLCSYVYINVNGEEWGLYLAAEAVEDAFLNRNYGGEKGDLYKPDSTGFGGGDVFPGGVFSGTGFPGDGEGFQNGGFQGEHGKFAGGGSQE